MPNWFYFSVTVTGDKKEVEQFIENVKGSEKFETEGREFDFNHFIPQPDNIFRGNLSFGEEKELKEKGIPDWYSWNNQNWGTKWNAVCDDFEDYDLESSDIPEVRYDLRTAWAFPSPVIEKMIEDYSNLSFLIVGEEESNVYGVHINTELNIWEEEEPAMIDEYSDREVYWESEDNMWHYMDDDSLVPDQDDFYPFHKYSWS